MINTRYHMPAEWDRHEACWMAWPCHQQTWQNIGLTRAYQAFARVANAISQFEPVKMLLRPEDIAIATQYLSESVTLMPLAINDSWTRDTGPSFVFTADGELAGIDWQFNAWGQNYPDYALDQQIAKYILNLTTSKRIEADFIMEGGAFHVDGRGTLLTTKECLLNPNRNPHLTQDNVEARLKSHLGVQKIIWLERGLIGDETDGHVDEVATFIAPEKVLCLITSDKQDENYALLRANYELLTTATDANHQKFEVHTVEMPPATVISGERLTLSYINFYRANGGIIMPSFGHEAHDALAYELFQGLFPDATIMQIDALDVFAGGGGIHCITQQQPERHRRS